MTFQAKLDSIVHRYHAEMGSDLCEWAGRLAEVRRGAASNWPGFKADRLRAAGEYRQSVARELAYQRRGRAGLRAMLLQQGIPCNW